MKKMIFCAGFIALVAIAMSTASAQMKLVFPTGTYFVYDGMSNTFSTRKLRESNVVKSYDYSYEEFINFLKGIKSIKPVNHNVSIEPYDFIMRNALQNTYEEYGKVIKVKIYNKTNKPKNGFTGGLVIKGYDEPVFYSVIKIEETINPKSYIIWEGLIKVSYDTEHYSLLHNSGRSLSYDFYEYTDNPKPAYSSF